MLGHRKLTEYKRTNLPQPDTKHFHKTFTPQTDTLDTLSFDIRFAGKNAHMSSTMFVERTLNFESRIDNAFAEYYDEDLASVPIPNNATTVTCLPGFLLQGNCKSFMMNYNSSCDLIKNPDVWLHPYSNLYRDDLENLIRGSGRNFSDH